MLKLTYLYHSGYLLETASAYVVFDYFLDAPDLASGDPRAAQGSAQGAASFSKQGVLPKIGSEAMSFEVFADLGLTPPLSDRAGLVASLLTHLDKPCYFIASHFHRDHFNPFILKFCDYVQELRAQHVQHVQRASHAQQSSENPLLSLPPVYLLLSNDIRSKRKRMVTPYIEQGLVTVLRKGESYTLPDLKVQVFGSTDVGISCVVSIDGYEIFHAGDFNLWHWQDESTAAEIKTATDFFQRELSFVVEHFSGTFDVAMFPCDPRMVSDFLSGAKHFVSAIPTKVLVPMHMWEQPQQVVKAIKADVVLQQYDLTVHANPNDLPVSSAEQAMHLSAEHKRVWVPMGAGDFCYFI